MSPPSVARDPGCRTQAQGLLPPPEGLLLDAMGTLIGLRQSVGHTYAALAADHGLSVDAAAIDAVFPRIHRQAPPLAFPGLEGAAYYYYEIPKNKVNDWMRALFEEAKTV